MLLLVALMNWVRPGIRAFVENRPDNDLIFVILPDFLSLLHIQSVIDLFAKVAHINTAPPIYTWMLSGFLLKSPGFLQKIALMKNWYH